MNDRIEQEETFCEIMEATERYLQLYPALTELFKKVQTTLFCFDIHRFRVSLNWLKQSTRSESTMSAL